MNNIDVILYEIGDLVIRKNKLPDVYGNDAVCEEVVDIKTVENERYYYQILFFKSDPTSGHVALEYEPYNEVYKEAYYKLIRAKNDIKPKKSNRILKPEIANKVEDYIDKKIKFPNIILKSK